MPGAADISDARAGNHRGQFPLGAAVTVADLDGDPHVLLRRLREREPVSWLPALGGWLVTRHDLAFRVMRDSKTFTVDDPRFSTARVVGPSMLSLDGAAHRRHRDPFTQAFRGADASASLESFAVATAGRLVAGIRPDGRASCAAAWPARWRSPSSPRSSVSPSRPWRHPVLVRRHRQRRDSAVGGLRPG